MSCIKINVAQIVIVIADLYSTTSRETIKPDNMKPQSKRGLQALVKKNG